MNHIECPYGRKIAVRTECSGPSDSCRTGHRLPVEIIPVVGRLNGKIITLFRHSVVQSPDRNVHPGILAHDGHLFRHTGSCRRKLQLSEKQVVRHAVIRIVLHKQRNCPIFEPAAVVRNMELLPKYDSRPDSAREA